MKLNPVFLVHHSGNETVIVPTDSAVFSGIIRGNKTLGEIADLLQTDRTKSEIVETLLSRYDAPRETIEKDVDNIVEQLRSVGAIL